MEKLRWFRRGGVLQVLGDTLDEGQMRRWAPEIGVADLLDHMLRDSSREE